LFRVKCAMLKLKTLKGTPLEKALQAACEAGITEPHIPRRIWEKSSMPEKCELAFRFLVHLRYQADTKRFRRPATAEATARQWTGQWSGLTEQTISNVLSKNYLKQI